jgi:indolepyruvate ferredoxin oxidoreductase
MLRAMKFVRGTPFDPFGRTEMRKLERSLVEEFCLQIASISSQLTDENIVSAQRVLESPELIRGFEGVKRASLERYYIERDMALAKFKAESENITEFVRQS